MQFEKDGQFWQVIDSVAGGDIAVLVVDGKATQRKAWFPSPKQTKASRETLAVQLDDLPF